MEITQHSVHILELLGEVERADGESFPPQTPPQDGDKPITDASPYARKVFSLWQFYQREVERHAVELKYAGADNTTLIAQIDHYNHKVAILSHIFWFVAGAENGLWGVNVGIRKDWKIVERPPCNPESSLRRFFGTLGQL